MTERSEFSPNVEQAIKESIQNVSNALKSLSDEEGKIEGKSENEETP